MKNQKTEHKQRISVNALVLPIVVILAVLHIIIVVTIIKINNTSTALSTIMQNQGIYTQEATSLLGGSSLLSETATSFVLMPTTETGESNYQPLIAYATELAVPEHRSAAVLSNFQNYEIPEEAYTQLQDAASSVDYLLNCQLHALALARAAHPTPPIPQLEAIPAYELTEEENALSAEEKMSAARALLISMEYSQSKGLVSQNVNGCVESMQRSSGILAAQSSRRLAILRKIMWGVTLLIIALLIFVFIALYTQLINPLGVFVKVIPTGQPLDESHSFREVGMVASAYNSVLKRRDALDSILRSAAETDALTNLPNRYRFEQYILESEESASSLAVLLFDVNYLKKINDTQGHLAGDNLIRTAADCISSCFGKNCFRFGGDEFAAVITDCTPDEIEGLIEQFRRKTREQSISISVGYAYTEDISKTSFRVLLDQADKNMYRQKQKDHEDITA